MKLEEIGFYTLSDGRAQRASATSPLERCELILTDRCNLRCRYCRGLRTDLRGDLSMEEAFDWLDLWVDQGLKNVRFSGGEPTLHGGLCNLVSYCKRRGVKRIAVSTNGTASACLYRQLFICGVNDFSVSLDGACCSIGDSAGGVPGCWQKAVDTIRMLSEWTYVTVGVVLTEENAAEAERIIEFASELGVADIRIIPAAQYQTALVDTAVPERLLGKHPILRYRIENAKQEKPVRGLNGNSSRRCRLVLDDIAVAQKQHFSCIIYLREGGKAIGDIGAGVREARNEWSLEHNVLDDPICRNNCLDVCAAYNRAAEF